MGFIFNATAWDRGSRLIDDMERDKRQAAQDERQAERDERERTTYEETRAEKTKTKALTESILEDAKSSKAPDVTTYMRDFIGEQPREPLAPQVKLAEEPKKIDSSSAATANPIQHNVMTEGEPFGSFSGDPRQILASIQRLQKTNPAEGERAMAAYRLQLNNPARNAELLVAEQARREQLTQPVPAPAAQQQAPAAPLASMEKVAGPKPYQPPPEALKRREGMVKELELAASISPQAAMLAKANLERFDMALAGSAMRHQVMNMPEAEFNQLMDKMDTSPQIDLKSTPDGRGGTTLTIGEKKVKLNRDQAADWLTGMYLIHAGDMEGGKKIIDGINTKLGEVSAKFLTNTLALRKDAREETDTSSQAQYRERLGGAATMRAANAGSSAQGGDDQPGVVMSEVDKVLGPMFNTEDPATGAKKPNVPAYSFVRQLATQMPAALQGDATGAALQAAHAYELALAQAKGNHASAVQLLQQKIAGGQARQAQPAAQPVVQGAPAVAPAPSAATIPPPSKPREIQLMQPLYDLGALRRRMQAESQDQ